ncbi:MAG: glycosyltransferase [Methanomicrobiales archaeon]
MDIACIIPKLNTIGGGEKFLIECIKRWQKKNEITLYTTSLDQKIIDEYSLEIQVKLLDTFFSTNSKKGFLTLPLEIRRFKNQINDHEIYNPHLFPTNLIDIHPSIWYPHEPPRVLYDLNQFFFKRKDINLSEKLLGRFYFPILRFMNENYTKIDNIVANSHFSKVYLEKVYKKDINNVVYPGVDTKNFNYSKKFNNVLLTVNRLFPEKRVDLSIKAMQYIDDFELWIVGEGSFKTYLKKLSEKLEVSDRVKFCGFVDEKELFRIYAKCFCTLYTPLREPFGMVALESMAAGKPLIACKDGGFTEIVQNGIHGFLVDNNPKIIAEKVNYLINNIDLYNNMCKACRKDSKKYSWDSTSNKLLNLFKKNVYNKEIKI